MAVPSRKSKMIHNFIADQNRTKKESRIEEEDKKVDSEEHDKRIEMLKEMGLIKDN